MICVNCSREFGGGFFCTWCGTAVRGHRAFLQFAPFWRRALAMLIDVILLAPVFLFLNIRFLPPSREDLGATQQLASDQLTYTERQVVQTKLMNRAGQLIALVFFVSGIYYCLTEGSALQGTIGKRLLRLRVTDMEGKRIGPGRALARYLARILSLMLWLVGFVMAAFTAKHQSLHDILTETLVLAVNKSNLAVPKVPHVQ